MEWLETRTPARPDDPGDAAFLRGDHEAAIEAYEAAAARGGFTRWARLAEAYLALGQPMQLFATCARGERDAGPSAALHYARGHGLLMIGQPAHARAAFEQALAIGAGTLAPLKSILRPMAADPDGAAMLAYCDALAPRYRDTALARAYRAVALSRMGRIAEARGLVDLEAHVVRMPMPVPAGYADIAAFNDALAAEILADPPAIETSARCAINYDPRIGPAMAALLAFTREAMTGYATRLGELGLADAMPPPPAAARLLTATTVLRRLGRNRQHIHPAGYISSVYHVRVPEGSPDDDRGALILGPCDEAATGHSACWGTRIVPAKEGWLTLFPSHVFHDVIPSQTDEPRISVACDLSPCGLPD